ncbi:MAG: hypothetical protein V3T48_06085, partial [Vicinamibacterales bacterium]
MKISRNAPCTVSGNMISGTYASFNCTVAISIGRHLGRGGVTHAVHRELVIRDERQGPLDRIGAIL